MYESLESHYLDREKTETKNIVLQEQLFQTLAWDVYIQKSIIHILSNMTSISLCQESATLLIQNLNTLNTKNYKKYYH